jgi:hypothetical protein
MISFAIPALIAFLGISLIPIYLLHRREYSRAREYFVASEPTPSGVVQNCSIGYSLQILTFGQFFSWGANGDFWPAIVCSAMFGVGLCLIYRLRRPMLAFLTRALGRDRSVTVPGFIARQHGASSRVQLFAAALSVFAFTGLVTNTAIGVASLVKPILPSGLNGPIPLAFGLLALMMIYTIPAGNSGAMRSTQALLGLLYFGLIGSTLVVLYMLISSALRMPPHGTFAVVVLAVCCAIVLIYRRSRYIDTSPIGRTVPGESTNIDPLTVRVFRRFSRVLNDVIAVLVATTLVIALIDLYAQGLPAVTESIAALQAKTRMSDTGLLGLTLLPLFYPIVETTNWLRIAALETEANSDRTEGFRTPKALARVLAMYAGATALLWLFICVLGTIAVLATGTSDGSHILQAFLVQLASQQNEVADLALWLFVVSLIAMAVSTMSAMFSSSLATIRYDIVPAVWPGLAPELAQPRDQAIARRIAIIVGGTLCAAMLVLLNDCYDGSFTNDRFLVAQLACFCAHLAFSPLVLGPLIGGNSAAISPTWATAVLGAGVGAGQGVVVVSLQTEHTAWLWGAVPACLGFGFLVYAIALLWVRRTA